jgi:hypothetical protein
MFHDRIAPVVDRLLRALAAAQLIITINHYADPPPAPVDNPADLTRQRQPRWGARACFIS